MGSGRGVDWIDLTQDMDEWRGSCKHSCEPCGFMSGVSCLDTQLSACQTGLYSLLLFKFISKHYFLLINLLHCFYY